MTHPLQLLLHSARDGLRSGFVFQMTQSVSDQRILIESRVVIVQEAAWRRLPHHSSLPSFV